MSAQEPPKSLIELVLAAGFRLLGPSPQRGAVIRIDGRDYG